MTTNGSERKPPYTGDSELSELFDSATYRIAPRSFRPALVVVVAACAVSYAQVSPNVDLTEPTVIDSGRTLFRRYCSVGYCHGKDGRAGRGPRFRGRKLDREHMFRSISEGIPSSTMPRWRPAFNDAQIWSVIAYIETLSELDPGLPSLSGEEGESRQELARWLPALFSASVPQQEKKRGTAADRPTSIAALKRELGWDFDADLSGNPQEGQNLFFQLSETPTCAACHKLNGKGGDIGPDLSHSSNKPAREFFKNIVVPDAEVVPTGKLFEMTTTSKERLRVVLSGESASRIKVYEVSGMPVFRSIKKSEVIALAPGGRSAMPASYSKVYTLEELLHIVAFLKSSSADSTVSVSLADLL